MTGLSRARRRRRFGVARAARYRGRRGALRRAAASCACSHRACATRWRDTTRAAPGFARSRAAAQGGDPDRPPARRRARRRRERARSSPTTRCRASERAFAEQVQAGAHAAAGGHGGRVSPAGRDRRPLPGADAAARSRAAGVGAAGGRSPRASATRSSIPGSSRPRRGSSCTELPRYLTALDRRLAKYAERPDRDARHAEQVAQLVAALRRAGRRATARPARRPAAGGLSLAAGGAAGFALRAGAEDPVPGFVQARRKGVARSLSATERRVGPRRAKTAWRSRVARCVLRCSRYCSPGSGLCYSKFAVMLPNALTSQASPSDRIDVNATTTEAARQAAAGPRARAHSQRMPRSRRSSADDGVRADSRPGRRPADGPREQDRRARGAADVPRRARHAEDRAARADGGVRAPAAQAHRRAHRRQDASRRRTSRRSTPRKLTLVETLSMDESVLSGNITRVVENLCHDELARAQSRRGLPARRAGPRDRQQSARAGDDRRRVHGAVELAQDRRKIKFQIMKDLNQAQLGEITAIYADLNKHLTRLNMMPGAGPLGRHPSRARGRRARRRRRRSRRRRQPAAEVDVMAMFKRMYGSATPQAPAPQMPLRCRSAVRPSDPDGDFPAISMPGAPTHGVRAAAADAVGLRAGRADHFHAGPARRPDPAAGRPDRFRRRRRAGRVLRHSAGTAQRPARPAGIAARRRRRTSSNR